MEVRALLLWLVMFRLCFCLTSVPTSRNVQPVVKARAGKPKKRVGSTVSILTYVLTEVGCPVARLGFMCGMPLRESRQARASVPTGPLIHAVGQ